LPGAGNFSRSVTFPWCAQKTSRSAISEVVIFPSQACERLIGEVAKARASDGESIFPFSRR